MTSSSSYIMRQFRRARTLGIKGTSIRAISRAERVLQVQRGRLLLHQDGLTFSRRPNDEQVLDLLQVRTALRSNDALVVYDIGANIGRFAGAMALSTNVSQVIAFEPVPIAHEELIQLAAQEDKISALPIALGNEIGSATVNVSASSASSSILSMTSAHLAYFPNTFIKETIQVPITTLDEARRSLNLPQPNLLKLDVQGYELEVVQGGTNTLAGSDWCLVEVSLVSLYENSPGPTQLIESLGDFGFTLQDIGGRLSTDNEDALQLDLLFRREESQL